MNTYVEIGGNRYPAMITGKISDNNWDNRASKAITVEMNYEDAVKIFVDDVQWSIVQEHEELVEKHNEEGNIVVDENGDTVFVSTTVVDSYDNSEYSIAGDITNHRDGRVTVKMGKPTAEELLAMLEEVL